MSKLSDLKNILLEYEKSKEKVTKEELLEVLKELVNYTATLETECINLVQSRERSKTKATVQAPFAWQTLRKDHSPFKCFQASNTN